LDQRAARAVAVSVLIKAIQQPDRLYECVRQQLAYPESSSAATTVRTCPSRATSAAWKDGREPFLLETSRPGVFAAGDVRSGSIKRVASAVGEGAMAVKFVHHYLNEM
jgi:thioredoxin reductase